MTAESITSFLINNIFLDFDCKLALLSKSPKKSLRFLKKTYLFGDFYYYYKQILIAIIRGNIFHIEKIEQN